MGSERRRHRSGVTVEAVRLLLESCEERFGLELMALLDMQGTPFASRSTPQEAVLAAYVPLLYHQSKDEGDLSVAASLSHELPELRGKNLKVRRFVLEDDLMFLCAMAADEKPDEEAFEHAIEGIRRIMEEEQGV